MTQRTLAAWLVQVIIAVAIIAQTTFQTALAEEGGHEVASCKSGCGTDKPENEHDHADEGLVRLSADALRQVGVKVAVAGPATIHVTLRLTGKLKALEDRVSHVSARFPGVLREVKKRLGDVVTKGETLAIVENNQTLQLYDVKTQIPGVIVGRHATVGEAVSEQSGIFEVADYSQLYADLDVFPTDFRRVRLGQRVLVRLPDEFETMESTISFLSPVTDSETQSRFVRAVLPNSAGEHQPGMFVTGDIILEETSVPVAVDGPAVRTMDGSSIVFVEEADGLFRAQRVIVGRSDRDHSEILNGIAAGERYATGNTFILLAELGKGEAEHDH